MARRVLVDFDGVIHSYKSGWKGSTVIPDPPVPGAKEALASLREKGYKLYVFSTRSLDGPKANDAMRAYLKEHGIVVDGIADKKIPASLTIDDRGFRFDGNWAKVLAFVEDNPEFTPWHKSVEYKQAAVEGSLENGEDDDKE